jgi:hydroxymethylbilane synthase
MGVRLVATGFSRLVTDRIRVGTRRSALARAQTEWVLARLSRVAPETRFEATPIDTSGDRNRTPGTSPDFTDTIDRAVLRGDVDLAVHSAKDLPGVLDRRFEILACPRRADPRDCLVVADRLRGRELPRGSRVGSSSLRRRAQLLRWRPDLKVVEIRGNVDTRIGLVRSGRLDAVVLALAGVARLGRRTEIDRVLPASRFLPAPAQGALAVLGRRADEALRTLVGPLDHPMTHSCVVAERSFASVLGGDCNLPLGALATSKIRHLSLAGEILTPDGTRSLCEEREGAVASADRLGTALGRAMLDHGALSFVSGAPGG